MAASSCFSCLGLSQWEASVLALWDTISQNAAIDPVADFIARAGITDQTQIDAVTALHAAAVDHGWWDKCDLIYPFVGGTAQAHAQNLKSAQFTITWAGTVTHDANGITGAGGYGDTGYIPASSGQVTLDSVHLSRWRRSVGTNGKVYCGANSVPSGALYLDKGAFATSMGWVANSNVPSSANSGVLGLSAVVRNDAANQHFFHAGVDTSAAAASTFIAAVSIVVLGVNNNGVPGGVTTANLSSVTAGSGITFAEFTAMNTDWVAFNAALGR